MSTPHPDAERLTLAALPAESADPDVSAHLLACARCRAEVDALRRTVELARAVGVGEPLPVPPTRVWQAVVDELGADTTAADPPAGEQRVTRPPGAEPVAERPVTRPPGAEPVVGVPGAEPVVGAPIVGPPVVEPVVGAPIVGPPVVDGRVRPAPGPAVPSRPARRRGRVAAGIAAAAVVGLGLGVGIGLGVGGSADPAPAPVVRLDPVGAADPAAGGTAAMVDHDGDTRMLVEVRGVTNLAGGDYLEAWLMDATGTRLLPLGALARHGEEFRGEFTIPAGLPVGEYDRVDVSAERFDGDPGHSTVSLLRGDLA